MKKCRQCEQTLPLDSFPESALSKDGHAYTCKTCKRMLLDTKRRPNVLALTPAQERDARYTRLLQRHGYSSACFYMRMTAAGFGPEQALALAEAAFSDNGRYWRLRRQIGVKFNLGR